MINILILNGLLKNLFYPIKIRKIFLLKNLLNYMDNLKIYCMCLDNNYLNIVKKLNYIPVGLKNKNFSSEWLLDNTFDNISEKNPFYGEYTFYYWYWKNLLQEEDSEWIGFCQRRRLWIQSRKDIEKIDGKNISSYILREPIEDWSNYESILCEPIKVSGEKKVKMIKRGWKNILKNPKVLFDKNPYLLLFCMVIHHFLLFLYNLHLLC